VNFILYFNASEDGVEFTLPGSEYAGNWEVLIDTTTAVPEPRSVAAASTLTVGGRSVIVLRAVAA
jgi:isoamylase